MKPFKFLILISLAASVILVYPGCSSSSNSIRYNSSSKSKTKDNLPVRFTSTHDNGNILNDKVNNIDTVNPGLNNDLNDIPENEKSINILPMVQKFSSSGANNNIRINGAVLKEKMLMDIIKYLNTPYKWGGNSKKGIDCSAFTQKIYQQTFSIHLDRTTQEQYQEGEPVSSIEDLRFGDLVFFNTRPRVRPGHVGVYIGDNLFAHSSSSRGVIVSSIMDNYYRTKFMGGRRIANLFGADTFTGNR